MSTDSEGTTMTYRKYFSFSSSRELIQVLLEDIWSSAGRTQHINILQLKVTHLALISFT